MSDINQLVLEALSKRDEEEFDDRFKSHMRGEGAKQGAIHGAVLGGLLTGIRAIHDHPQAVLPIAGIGALVGGGLGTIAGTVAHHYDAKQTLKYPALRKEAKKIMIPYWKQHDKER